MRRHWYKLSKITAAMSIAIACLKTVATYAIVADLPDGVAYELREQNRNRIHIVRINPALHKMELIKSHDQVFGREFVPGIAHRTNAVVAVNAGFFEIGGNDDGKPSGTLIIDGQIFGVKTIKHDVLLQDKQGITVRKLPASPLRVCANNKEIKLLRFNQFADSTHPILYTSQWGPTTLSPYSSRQEFLIDANYKVVGCIAHGNNKILAEGFVLSYPHAAKLPCLKIGDTIKIEGINKDLSMVMGIPALIQEGKILAQLGEHKKEAFTSPHARTAVGMDSRGHLILVVAEHAYKQELKDVTLRQVRDIFKARQVPLDKMSIIDSLKVVEEHLTPAHAAVGLTLQELAALMLSLGCQSAINLDGGGSSMLWIKGQVINHPIGDQDEAMGESKWRPVSDALVFIPRK